MRLQPWHRNTAALFAIIAALWIFSCNTCQAVELTADEQRALEQIDAGSAAKILEVVAKLQAWQAKISEAMRLAGAVSNGLGDSDQISNLVFQLTEELKQLVVSVPQVRAIVNYEAQIAPILAEAERKRRAATANLEQVRRAANGEASQKLRAYYDSVVFQKINQLKNPAEYARGFLDGKFREWTEKPLPVGDKDSLVFKILPPPAGVPVFSPNAKLDVEIEYLPGDLTVKATGLYFRYKSGGAPEPVLDQLKVEVDVRKTVLNKLRGLGEEITEDLDLPITVKLRENPSFAVASGTRAGGIPFDIEVNFLGSEFAKAEGKGFTLYPGNDVDWQGKEFTLDVPFTPPIPIGPQPVFAICSMKGSYGPKDKSLGFSTKISTMATPSELIHLDVGVKTQVPVRDLEIKGDLKVASLSLMGVKGKIDFTKGIVDGDFLPSDSGVPLPVPVGFKRGKFHLQRELFIAEGSMAVFGQECADMYCEVNLKDGSTLLMADGSLEVFGAEANASFEGRIDANFSRFRASCQVSVEVPGIKPYGTLWASVALDMDSKEGIDVDVKTFVKGLDFHEHVDSLSDCTPEKLAEWLQERSVEAYKQFLDDLATGDADARRFAAKMDQQTRDYVHEKFGITWKTGNPQLDALGGQLAQGLKDLGGGATDLLKAGGGALSSGGKTLASGFSDAIGTGGGDSKPFWER